LQCSFQFLNFPKKRTTTTQNHYWYDKHTVNVCMLNLLLELIDFCSF
jgi:hypothetical protein